MLTTSRLILRDYKIDDWVAVHEYAQVPEFSQYDVWGPNTEKDSQEFVASMVREAKSEPRFRFQYAVCLRDGGRLIGGAGLRRETESSGIANFGYAINPAFQGLGYATEATYALLEFGFGKLELDVVYATCDLENRPSYRVMEKLRMRRVGLSLRSKEFKGRWHDNLRYEITRAEFNELAQEKTQA